jgi:predicted ribosome quality control (RQC) complex YloA/Tae2 family protein
LLDNFFLLKEVAVFLEKEITGYSIKEIHTQEKDKLVITLFNPISPGLKFIEFSAEDKLPYLLLKNEYSKAKKNSVNLLAGLYEQEIFETGIYNNDRIIKINLSNDISVFFVFFKSKYNLLVATDGKIIDSFKNKKELIGSFIDEYLDKKVSKPKTVNTVKEYYRYHFRKYGDFVYNELLFICKLSGEDISNDRIKELIDNYIDTVNLKLEDPVFFIYIYKSDYIPSLIELTYTGSSEKYIHGNVNELLQNFIKLYIGKTSNRDVKKNILHQKGNALRSSEKKLNSLLKQLEVAGNANQFKTFGDLILSNINLINKGDSELIIDDGGITDKIKINLKKDLSPSENASAYYDKYKRQKNSADLLNEKIKKQEAEIESLKQELEDIKNNKNLKSLRAMEKEYTKTDESDRFRKFVLNEKYEVWVGKDSASNDLLTTRYSAQNDLWFHVRGASGSHTVLKVSDKKNPPDKKIIETAASIAAYYSKARSASNVPVAYCERKYVKKKKGFKEGSVIMEREKVIFVRPCLPENMI